MDTNEAFRRLETSCEDLSEADELIGREILESVADKWTLWTMHVLGHGGRMRFSRVLEQVEGVSQKMLTKTLRQLERDGLATRTMYMEVPPRVEYELTELGKEMVVQALPLLLWVVEKREAFKSARHKYDEGTL